MKIERKCGLVNISVEFNSKWVLLTGNSGTGKSYLCRMLYKMAHHIGIKVALFNYLSSVEDIVSLSRGRDLVCLDDADHYMTDDLMSELDKLDCQFILCKKSIAGLHTQNTYEYGYIKYDGDSLIYEKDDRRGGFIYNKNSFISMSANKEI